MDTDYDGVSVEETLSRHRQILERYCRDKKLNVVEALEEVVSGESLATRPQMMRLLDLVSICMYALLKRERKKALQGVPKQRGRKPAKTLQEYKYENKRLKMEVELLRNFLQSTEGM